MIDTPELRRVPHRMMPLTGIQLLFETLVQCTRDVCKCEMRDDGSKDCNLCGSKNPGNRLICRAK